MSDPLAASLSKFTPDASGLDRDALLFAAGRASVRPRRRWLVLAGALAASQLVTLTLLGFQATRPVLVPDPAPGFFAVPNPAPPHELAPAPVRDGHSYWPLRDRALATDDPLSSPEPVEPLAPADAPLRAFAAPPSMLLQ